MPDSHCDQIRQLTPGELDRYAAQLARCLKALDTTAPIRAHVQDELAAVRAEQDTCTAAGAPGNPRRQYDAGGLTAGELERTRRELAASLALTRPDSPPARRSRRSWPPSTPNSPRGPPARPDRPLRCNVPGLIPADRRRAPSRLRRNPRRADPHPGPVHADD
jgi:hypothetical protein